MTDLARDVRMGGAWTPAQAAKNHALYALAATSLWVGTRLPRPLARAAGACLGHAAWLASASLRRAVAARAPLSSRAVLAGLGRTLADTVGVLSPSRPLPLRCEPSDLEALRGALEPGRGVVYATAHLGVWEAMGPLLVGHGFPITTVARESYDPRFDRVYARLRDARGVEVLYRGHPGFPRQLVRALKQNRVVGFPMDLAGRGVRAIDVPWLGGWMRRTPVGPAELALRLGCEVVVGTPAPGGRLRLERVPTDGLDPEALTAALASQLSARILALPDAWPWGLLG